MPYAVPWRRLDLRHTCAINVTLLGLSLLISTSPALETIQDAVLVSLNWTGGITSADVKPTYLFICEMHAYSEKSVRACMKLDSEWQHLKYCYKRKVENATEMLQNDRARATLAPAPLF